jgi:CRISPR-associated protein (TIGR02710 family)
MKILMLTVGGSPQPIITSIKTLKPDRVIFICSENTERNKGSINQVIGDGNPCEIHKNKDVVERLPNLPTLLQLGNRFDCNSDLLAIQDPDDQAECYRKITGFIGKLLQSNQCELVADYTGGTKTMSMALAMAAIDFNIKLYLTTGSRRDLTRVRFGETTELVSTALINVERKLELILPMLLDRYDYAAAVGQLENLLHSYHFSGDDKVKVRNLIACCRAFDFWDKFDHRQAYEELQSFFKYKEIAKVGQFLRQIMGSRAVLDKDFL